MSRFASPRIRARVRLFALAEIIWVTSAACFAEPSRPNVLFLLTEDHGPHLSLLGTPGLSTLNIDALAATGVYFDRAFVVYPVCSASKAALYTGLYSHVNGLMGNVRNTFKPAHERAADEFFPARQTAQIRDEFPTLVEILHEAGYYTGVARKLQVQPIEKFPYDEFIGREISNPVPGFIRRANREGKPWFLMRTIGSTHRPFPNSDERAIGVDPRVVALPKFLPDTPIVRKDWAEYLAAIELADEQVGNAIEALRLSDEAANTIVVLMGDHGPAFQRGKMSLHDFGVHVPLVFSGQTLSAGIMSHAVVTELDVMPTLLDLLGLQQPALQHGVSLRSVLEGRPRLGEREFVFAELAHRLPNIVQGMQERSVYDGRYRLIVRERWRQARVVNADLREWKRWRNRSYDETVRQQRRFPLQFRLLAEIDPARLGGSPPRLELYDTIEDPDEVENLAADAGAEPNLRRLFAALARWTAATGDPYVRLGDGSSISLGRD